MRATQQVWIRAADPDDRASITGLLREATQGPSAREGGWRSERLIVAEVHQAQLPQARLALADQAGCCIVGAARLEPLPDGSSEVAEVVVDPRCRDRGLDRALAEAASQRADP